MVYYYENFLLCCTYRLSLFTFDCSRYLNLTARANRSRKLISYLLRIKIEQDCDARHPACTDHTRPQPTIQCPVPTTHFTVLRCMMPCTAPFFLKFRLIIANRLANHQDTLDSCHGLVETRNNLFFSQLHFFVWNHFSADFLKTLRRLHLRPLLTMDHLPASLTLLFAVYEIQGLVIDNCNNNKVEIYEDTPTPVICRDINSEAGVTWYRGDENIGHCYSQGTCSIHSGYQFNRQQKSTESRLTIASDYPLHNGLIIACEDKKTNSRASCTLMIKLVPENVKTSCPPSGARHVVNNTSFLSTNGGIMFSTSEKQHTNYGTHGGSTVSPKDTSSLLTSATEMMIIGGAAAGGAVVVFLLLIIYLIRRKRQSLVRRVSRSNSSPAKTEQPDFEDHINEVYDSCDKPV